MPDTIATHKWHGETYLVMANEGDFREDDGDRSAASSTGIGAVAPLNNLRVSNTDSSRGQSFRRGRAVVLDSRQDGQHHLRQR